MIEKILEQATEKITDIYLEEGKKAKYAVLKEIIFEGPLFTKEDAEELDKYIKDKLSVGLKLKGKFLRITKNVNIKGNRVYTIRILHKKYLNFENEEEEYKNLINLAIKRDLSGLVLFCGPTGAGKTTTIYSTLLHIAKNKGFCINTYENPVEIILDNENLKGEIYQYEENNFKKIIYHFLLSSPRIGFISEVKLKEEIENAIDLASRGHLIFTSIHVNNTFEALKLINQSVSGLSKIKFAQTLFACISTRFIKYKNDIIKIYEVFCPNYYIRRAIEEDRFLDIRRLFYQEDEKKINEYNIKFSNSLKRKIKDEEFVRKYIYENYFLFEDAKRL